MQKLLIFKDTDRLTVEGALQDDYFQAAESQDSGIMI